MHSVLAYLLAVAAGLLIAYFLSRPPELRALRLSQLIFVPIATVLCLYFLPVRNGSSSGGGVGDFVCFLVVLGFLILLVAPNIAHLGGTSVTNFLDPQDWTSTGEEIALRPIKLLIDKDQYSQALADLDELLKKHKPTYEARLLKAKLLHNLGRINETETALLSLIELCQTTPQQLAVMVLLAMIEEYHQEPPRPLGIGNRRVEIDHELVLFQVGGGSPDIHKEIPPGTYNVEETMHDNQYWLKLTGEDWGNAEMCWKAVRSDRHAIAPPKRVFFTRIMRMHENFASALTTKSRFQRQAEAKKLFQEASQFIRCDDWLGALPLLQKATACDPDHFEIAFRWLQAVRHTASDAAIEQALNQALAQSRWTEHEEQMLRQVKRSLVQ